VRGLTGELPAGREARQKKQGLFFSEPSLRNAAKAPGAAPSNDSKSITEPFVEINLFPLILTGRCTCLLGIAQVDKKKPHGCHLILYFPYQGGRRKRSPWARRVSVCGTLFVTAIFLLLASQSGKR
jgi:hypothetical protein